MSYAGFPCHSLSVFPVTLSLVLGLEDGHVPIVWLLLFMVYGQAMQRHVRLRYVGVVKTVSELEWYSHLGIVAPYWRAVDDQYCGRLDYEDGCWSWHKQRCSEVSALLHIGLADSNP